MKFLLLTILTFINVYAIAEPSETVRELQTEWAEIKYRVPEKEQEQLLAKLTEKTSELVENNPEDIDLLIWEGIIRATYSGAKGGLGALGEVKKARYSFEKAIKINPEAMGGSAYTSLGSLYYQVPSWPIGFCSSKKAKKMLEKGLELNPDGIDSNYFYGDYLLSEGKYDLALISLEKALKASPRSGRQLADEGRRQEIQQAIEKIRDRKK